MAPASVFDKAHRQLSCHAGASIIITDVWKISPMQYECLAMCSRCRRHGTKTQADCDEMT